MRALPVVDENDCVTWLPLDEVDFVQVEDRRIKIWSNEQSYFLITYVDDLFNLIELDGRFVRTEEKNFIRLGAIDSVDKEDRTATLSNGKVVPCSRSNIAFIIDRLRKYRKR